MLLPLLFLLLLLPLNPSTASPSPITLPGQPPNLPFQQYSGYICVSPTSGSIPCPSLPLPASSPLHALHYYYVTSSSSTPSSDPLALWQTGGPGCSSLLSAFTEIGPLHVSASSASSTTDDVSVSVHVHAWNQAAHVLFLEMPSGVGFSHGGNYTSGDSVYSYFAYHALLGFFTQFPALASRHVVLLGESYAGQYVPHLVDRIMMGQEQHPIKLVGWMVGNPSGLSSSEWEYGYWRFMRERGFLSIAQFEQLTRVCNESKAEPDCAELKQSLFTSNLYGLDPYNVYKPCVGDGSASRPYCFTQETVASLAASARPQTTDSSYGQTFVPCKSFAPLVTYLNRADVRKALGVPDLPFNWTVCSKFLVYNQFSPVVPIYKKYLGSTSLRALVYSGDVDSCVPFLGTQAGVRALNFTVKQPFHSWFYQADGIQLKQVGGHAESYAGNLTYTTIRGAGHMCPTDQPVPMLKVFTAFLSDSPL